MNIWMSVSIVLVIPFIGTTLGAACVFLLKDKLEGKLQKYLLGFAGGVMFAAAVWSLIIPSIENSSHLGKFASIPAAVGIGFGMLFLLVLDVVIPHLHVDSQNPEGPKSRLNRSAMLCLAVTLHNIPEGMSVGVVLASILSGNLGISFAAAFSLAIGIALQNFPEGAAISMPLAAENRKFKAFIYGVLSGIVEPIAALITILLTFLIVPILPYLLAFAAGAMLYVVVEELIPEGSSGEHSNLCTLGFALGFILMMVLDITFG